jgi:hypothetical protein
MANLNLVYCNCFISSLELQLNLDLVTFKIAEKYYDYLIILDYERILCSLNLLNSGGI